MGVVFVFIIDLTRLNRISGSYNDVYLYILTANYYPKIAFFVYDCYHHEAKIYRTQECSLLI